MKNCTLYFELGRDSLRVTSLNKPCRYHKFREVFLSSDISPDGLCPAAFAVLYPHCLSMLSRAKYPVVNNKEVCRIKCPGKSGTVEFNLFRQPFKRRGLERSFFYFKKIVDFFIPVELIENKVYIEVTTASEDCPFSYTEGETFEFNIGDKKEICPAAFYSLYPFYLSILDKTLNQHNNHNSGCLIPCSDYNTNIIFRLGDSGADSGNVTPYFFSKCDDFRNIYIKINSVQNCKYSYFRKGKDFGVNQLLEEMDIPCYSLFYNAFPYMLTLENGGSLGFLTLDRNAAGIQCPNMAVQIKMFIKKDKKKRFYSMKVFGNKGACPKGITKGQNYVMPAFSNQGLDITALANLFPYIMYFKYLIGIGRGLDRSITFYHHNGSSQIEFQIYRGKE